MFFYKSGSHTHIALVGIVAAEAKAVQSQAGGKYTLVRLTTKESYASDNGEKKISQRIVPVFLEGEQKNRRGGDSLPHGGTRHIRCHSQE